SPPHASTDRPSGFQVVRPTADMYEVFTCGDQMMDQIAQEYLASRAFEAPRAASVDAPVYRLEPPM
ncbi:hypothetical protein PIB30_092778, partial [Stylosanthes scabra]|nr:hypothetical protein [Stylosanthes scabra]